MVMGSGGAGRVITEARGRPLSKTVLLAPVLRMDDNCKMQAMADIGRGNCVEHPQLHTRTPLSRGSLNIEHVKKMLDRLDVGHDDKAAQD